MGTTSVGFTGSPTLLQTSTGTTTPGYAGLSNYSQDLQNELNREVALASLPMQQMQNDVNQLNSESSELNTLNSDFLSLQTAIANLGSASQSFLAASVSDPSVLSATAGTGALPGTYTVQVTQAGTYASAMSSDSVLPTVSDPTSQNIDGATSFVVTVSGATNATATISSVSNLNALVAAINANPALGLQATVVNVGPSSAPDYRLSLQSASLGATTIEVQAVQPDNSLSTNLLTPLTPGTSFEYQVNGEPAQPISSNSGTITLSSGLTVNLLGEGTSTVTVAPSAASLTNALSSFVTAYNNAVDEVGKNIGQSGGALAGQSIVYSLQQSLASLGSYTSSSNGITSLSDLGLTFDTSGHLNLDPSVLAGATSSQIDNIQSFLGSATGGGFLQFATNLLTSIEDPSTGLLPNQITQTTDSITSENALIAQQQDQINLLQTSLQSEMSSADSSIASLESQLSYYTGLFQAMILPSPMQLSTL